VVATNGKLHEKVLNAIADPKAKRKEPRL
jgi:hypothetical protein